MIVYGLVALALVAVLIAALVDMRMSRKLAREAARVADDVNWQSPDMAMMNGYIWTKRDGLWLIVADRRIK